MRRVLHVLAAAQRRGAEVFAQELADALSAFDWQSSLVALSREPGELELPTLGSRRLAPHTLTRLRSLVRRASVVVAHGSSTLPACAVASCSLSTPFVYRSVGDPRYWAPTPAKRWRTGLLLRRAARVVALTSEAAAALGAHYGLPAERIVVIPKAVDSARLPALTPHRRRAARHALRIHESSRVALCLGSLSEEKNPAMAIEAVAGLSDVLLLVAGSGPQLAFLREEAAKIAPARVRFMGSVADPVNLLWAADVLVVPSRTEGMPGVAMEAGMVGIPVVATAVGWVRDVVLDGVTGVVVRPGNSNELAAGITTALASADALGRAARAHCLAHFDIERIAERWDALLTEVIAR